ncbi:hypothetical protein EJ06DRAFT_543098 [Trichodelitschia bisporula]|uniref:FIT family protein scs3 n=1 Tax=Trichodelitschia bisporula TaxID=703511 RepID=A0A6G1HWB1_9PEZI|nr:hypothetical protein EJ06DRAFT_543098 [Trichodelitschia bisporula]
MATKRKPSPPPFSQYSAPPQPQPQTTTTASHPWHALTPHLPTPLETALLALYPLTLALGSLFASLAPHIRASPYSQQHQAFHPEKLAPAYWARKTNAWNVVFVKRGWGWVSAALLLFALSHRAFWRKANALEHAKARLNNPDTGAKALSARADERDNRDRRLRRLAQLFVRWALCTTAWAATTQWFLGPALIDRIFVLTGGGCVPPGGDTHAALAARSHAQCRRAGGAWLGGHDVSGHVFLLVLGSAMLGLEILPTVLRAAGLREERRVRKASGHVGRVGRSLEVESRDGGGDGGEGPTGLGTRIAIGVVGVCWWMLLMTAAFFHDWREKWAGGFIAGLVVWGVYFAPRGWAEWRGVVGMPGL